MEGICKRFHAAGRLILKHLDDQSLVKSKKANKEISKFLENERSYWIRILWKSKMTFEGFEISWNEVINRTQTETIKELVISVQQFLKSHPIWGTVAPLHIAIEKGSIELCQYIIRKTCNKNPGNVTGWTPLHWAANNNRLDLCRLINHN